MSGPGPAPTPCGVLVIDKPRGWTSMDVCARVRSRLRRGGAPKRIKVGHTGTLDPMATGVLVVLVGRATRLCERLMADRKTYEAQIDLSATSDTDDAEGRVTRVEVARRPTREEVEAAAGRFVGRIQQVPPAHSAVHVGGRRAYALAREGKAVDLGPRAVDVHAFRVTAYEWPCVGVEVECGKGTYIRSLARDLGAALSCGGMLTALRRTRSGEFGVDTARPIESLPEVLTQADLAPSPG